MKYNCYMIGGPNEKINAEDIVDAAKKMVQSRIGDPVRQDEVYAVVVKKSGLAYSVLIKSEYYWDGSLVWECASNFLVTDF